MHLPYVRTVHDPHLLLNYLFPCMGTMKRKLKLKLLHAKKAWKKVTTILQSKVRTLKRSKTIIKHTAASGLNGTISSILSRPRRPSQSDHDHHPTTNTRRGRIGTTHQPSSSRRRRRHNHHGRTTIAPVYVDDLYNNDDNNNNSYELRPTTTASEVVVVVVVKEYNSNSHVEKAEGSYNYSAPSATTDWKPPGADYHRVSSSVVADEKLDGVDLKAEMFIARFRQEISLQRQRSFKEYQEMLARGL